MIQGKSFKMKLNNQLVVRKPITAKLTVNVQMDRKENEVYFYQLLIEISSA